MYVKGVVAGIMARKLSWMLDFYCIGIEGGSFMDSMELSVDRWIF